jgi:arsenate reductase
MTDEHKSAGIFCGKSVKDNRQNDIQRLQRMIVVNGLKACDTCRKVLKALAAAGLDAELRDLRAVPPTRDEVEGWHGRFGAALLNTRSTTWRALPEAERGGDPVALVLAHPTLIKRPVIETADGPLLGWTADTRARLGL